MLGTTPGPSGPSLEFVVVYQTHVLYQAAICETFACFHCLRPVSGQLEARGQTMFCRTTVCRNNSLVILPFHKVEEWTRVSLFVEGVRQKIELEHEIVEKHFTQKVKACLGPDFLRVTET